VTHARVGDRLDTSEVERVLSPEDVIAIQETAARLQLDDSVLGYAVRLVRTARDWQGIETGPGPRASIALIRAARGHALTEGRDFVTPDDVKAMAPAALRHRIKLTADLEIEGYRPDDVLGDLLAGVPAPRQ
jgi:MoxR-like ATPase